MDNNILSLSGGNQQKALFARALASDARIILMDDPMRGVDIATRQEVYALIRQEARGGRTFLWYTTETDELLHCDHVYVFRDGAIVADLARGECQRGRSYPFLLPGDGLHGRVASACVRNLACCAPCCRLFAGLVLAAIAWLNPRAISYFGFNLMLNLAVPIALATVAQMFVIAGNDLDLSIGPFVSFVGCVAATWLNDAPLLGAAMLLAGIAVYAGLGALIHLRNLPSIVVTLGMSFVWQGLAILVLPQPGGAAPDWLRPLMSSSRPLCRCRSLRPRYRGHRLVLILMRTVLWRDPARLRRQRRRHRAAPAGRC